MSGILTWPLMNSLQLFWPGVAVQHGEAIDKLRESVLAFHTIWRKYGVTPEGFNLHYTQIQTGQKGYPLRPELAESLYFLYRSTKDPMYLSMGRDMVKSLSMICKAVSNIRNLTCYLALWLCQCIGCGITNIGRSNGKLLFGRDAQVLVFAL